MGEQHSHLTHVDLFTTKPCYRKRKTMAKNRSKMYEGRTVGRNLDFWTYYFMLIIVNTFKEHRGVVSLKVLQELCAA